jgi:signal transduction histidine kinase
MVKKRSIIYMILFVFLFASYCAGATLTPKMCKAKVQAAVKLLKKKGDAAFAAIKNPKGEFRFGNGKGYVWIHNLKGIMVMHPIKPSLNGKNLFGLKDSNEVYFFVAFNEMVEENGAGWVPYMWPKPGEKKVSPKISYVMLVKKKGKNYVVGSGMYDVTAKDIKKMFPGDPIYED